MFKKDIKKLKLPLGKKTLSFGKKTLLFGKSSCIGCEEYFYLYQNAKTKNWPIKYVLQADAEKL